MALPGRMPDPRAIHRNPLAEWTEVPEVPFDYLAAGHDLPDDAPADAAVARWYRAVAAMPHASLWRDGDWVALYDLALLKAEQYKGESNAAMISEIRRREATFGTTEEARHKNRIRYVPPARGANETSDTSEPETPSTVTPITSARDRMKRRA